MLSDDFVTRAPVAGCSPRQDLTGGVLKSARSEANRIFHTVPPQSTKHSLQSTELPLLLLCNCLIFSSTSSYKLHDSSCKRNWVMRVAGRVIRLGASGAALPGWLAAQVRIQVDNRDA